MIGFLNILRFFISKKVMAIHLCAICFCVNVFGHEECTVLDSVAVSQLYKINPCELTFNTEEQTIQSHDGQNVFCNKRQVEYRIVKTDSKLVIKRKVVSSENMILCEDMDLQMIYPDVTSILFCGLVKPGKIKTEDMLKSKLACSISKSGSDYVLVLDKISKAPKKEEKIMGETVFYDECTEKLKYSSSNGTISLDAINEIISKISIRVTRKDGSKHHVELMENIIVLK